MTLQEWLAFDELGLARVEDLPVVATSLVVAGFDSPSLCELASRPPQDDPRELRDLLEESTQIWV